MKKKTVKLVSAVVALGVVSGAYVGVNSYVSSQEKKESEAEDTSVELTSLDTDNITSVAFTTDILFLSSSYQSCSLAAAAISFV